MTQKQSEATSQSEPVAAEVESARLLANDVRDRLRTHGIDDETIDRLADRYIAEDLGHDPGEFIEWARRQQPSEPTPEEMSEDSFPASDPPSTWATAGGADPDPEAK